MTTLTVVQKGGVVAIAADSLSTQGSWKRPVGFTRGASKILSVNGSYIASAGWAAHMAVSQSLVRSRPEEFDLSSVDSIFETFRNLHKTLVDDYYLKTEEEDDDQPYESSQFTVLIANSTGIYEVQEYRQVIQCERSWALGSGCEFALGAMEALYEDASLSAKEIAERGVQMGCMFDAGSSLPLESYEVKLT